MKGEHRCVLSKKQFILVALGLMYVTSAHAADVLNINKPNSAGVSNNVYKKFDVNKSGTVFNNATAAAKSVLAGQVAANPNLAGKEAKVILNQVEGLKGIIGLPSKIAGDMEIAGHKADLIISNPNGIIVNGGKVYNAGNVTLTTGKPTFDEKGAIKSYDVNRGAVVFGSINPLAKKASGTFDASQADSLDVLAQAILVNNEIQAKKITAVTGQNTISADTKDIRSHMVSLGGLDATALGAMKAGDITLVGTGAGFGVKNKGTIDAKGALVIRANGLVENTNSMHGSTVDIATKGVFVSRSPVKVFDIDKNHVGQKIQTRATLAGDKAVTVKARDIELLGSVVKGGDVSLEAQKHFDALGVPIGSIQWKLGLPKDMNLEATYAPVGTEISGANVSLKAGNELLLQGADVKAAHNATLNADGIVLGSAINFSQGLTGASLKAKGTSISTGGDLSIHADKSVLVVGGSLDSQKKLTIDAKRDVIFTPAWEGEFKITPEFLKPHFDRQKGTFSFAGGSSLSAEGTFSTKGTVIHGKNDVSIGADRFLSLSGATVTADLTLRGDKGVFIGGGLAGNAKASIKFLKDFSVAADLGKLSIGAKSDTAFDTNISAGLKSVTSPINSSGKLDIISNGQVVLSDAALHSGGDLTIKSSGFSALGFRDRTAALNGKVALEADAGSISLKPFKFSIPELSFPTGASGTYESTFHGSSITSDKSIVIEANKRNALDFVNDINLVGSTIKAPSVTLKTDGNLNVFAGLNAKGQLQFDSKLGTGKIDFNGLPSLPGLNGATLKKVVGYSGQIISADGQLLKALLSGNPLKIASAAKARLDVGVTILKDVFKFKPVDIGKIIGWLTKNHGGIDFGSINTKGTSVISWKPSTIDAGDLKAQVAGNALLVGAHLTADKRLDMDVHHNLIMASLPDYSVNMDATFKEALGLNWQRFVKDRVKFLLEPLAFKTIDLFNYVLGFPVKLYEYTHTGGLTFKALNAKKQVADMTTISFKNGGLIHTGGLTELLGAGLVGGKDSQLQTKALLGQAIIGGSIEKVSLPKFNLPFKWDSEKHRIVFNPDWKLIPKIQLPVHLNWTRPCVENVQVSGLKLSPFVMAHDMNDVHKLPFKIPFFD